MADSNDDIDDKAKKYGWSPSEVAYYKSLRGDIPQAQPTQAPVASPNPSPTQTQSSQLNPQNIDPNLAQSVQSGFQGAVGMAQGGAVKGVTGGGSVMFGNTVIADHQRPALGYKNAPKYAQGGEVRKHYPSNHHANTTSTQVPGIEPAQQQIQVRQDALHKLKEHDRHRVRQPSPKKPK